MSIDHDKARELHATSLRALMESADIDTGLIRSIGIFGEGGPVYMDKIEAREVREAADWIDAVVAAWERGER